VWCPNSHPWRLFFTDTSAAGTDAALCGSRYHPHASVAEHSRLSPFGVDEKTGGKGAKRQHRGWMQKDTEISGFMCVVPYVTKAAESPTVGRYDGGNWRKYESRALSGMSVRGSCGFDFHFQRWCGVKLSLLCNVNVAPWHRTHSLRNGQGRVLGDDRIPGEISAEVGQARTTPSKPAVPPFLL
jgi:hypothetical protein